MAILDVKLISIESERETDGPTNTLTYLVITDGSETAKTVRDSGHASLPQMGASMGDGSYVTGVRVDRDKDSRKTAQVFKYQATFSPIAYSENPLSRPPEIQWEGLEIREVRQEDAEGTRYENSAGDLYSPLPERIVMGGACTITRNEASNPASICVNYSNTTNSGAWYGVAEGNGRMGVISSSKQYENGYTFWRTSYPIQFNRQGWRLKVYDNGYRKIINDPDGDYLENIRDRNGTQSPIPVYLDGAGKELPAGDPPVFFPTNGFKQEEATNWSALSLPNPFM